MTALNNRIKNVLKQMSDDMLIGKLKETLNDVKLSKMNYFIQEGLEGRLGEDRLDEILDEIR